MAFEGQSDVRMIATWDTTGMVSDIHGMLTNIRIHCLDHKQPHEKHHFPNVQFNCQLNIECLLCANGLKMNDESVRPII